MPSMMNLDGNVKTSLFGAKKKKKEKKLPPTSTNSKKTTQAKSSMNKENQYETSSNSKNSDRRKAFSPIDENLPNLAQRNTNSDQDDVEDLNYSSEELFTQEPTSNVETAKTSMSKKIFN